MSTAQLQRQWDLVALIEKRGGFDWGTAYLALRGDFEATEKVALWLCSEIKKLRNNKTTVVPRVDIADIAMTMLENQTVLVNLLNRLPWAGENLLHLLQELLEVDRHRKTATLNMKLVEAAALDGLAFHNGKRPLSVRKLARRVGVTPSSIVEWRRSPIYHREISKGLGITPRAVAHLLANRGVR